MTATTAAEGRRTFLTVFCFFFQHLFEKEEEESAETLYKTLPHETAQKKKQFENWRRSNLGLYQSAVSPAWDPFVLLLKIYATRISPRGKSV